MNRFDLTERAKRLIEKSVERGIKICAAESCTGGLVASSIVSISGASATFVGSAVCYKDSAKIDILGVSGNTINSSFAESVECAREMAEGALRIFGADISIATTGFLDSNVSEKPSDLAGRVFLCVCRKSDDASLVFNSQVVCLDPRRDRNENRAEVVAVALDMLLSQI